MEFSFNLTRDLDRHLRQIAAPLEAFPADFDPRIQPADPRFGDFQANGILPCAKAAKTNPRALAQELVDALEANGSLAAGGVEISIAGPGFINFAFKPATLLDWLRRHPGEAAFQEGAGAIYRGQRVVVDYPSPNTAKQMHIGHLRPMVIGEAVQRMLRFCGADVIRDNHIGDWGTNFGTLIMAVREQGVSLEALGERPLERLEELYKEGTRLEKENPALRDESRAELRKLQQGDPENLAMWERINAISREAFAGIYEALGLEFDYTLGESFYRDKVERVYRELSDAGIAQESQGALVVFHPEHPRFREQPFIIRKKDGASNYASIDLATALYRVEEFGAEEIVYVTDGRQQDHFQQLFLTLEKWFAAKGYPLPRLRHVWFGTILGEDGKAIKTRSGEPIRLRQLLEEAVERAGRIVAGKNPELDAGERARVARAVGLGAIRYADLSQNRTSDYVFAWEKLLSFEGNTAPYLLYAVARIHSIFRRAGLEVADPAHEAAATPFQTEAELALARKLARFPAALEMALGELRPHFIGAYLYELAGGFSACYNADKVIVDDPGLRARRLLLCGRTLAVLEAGLHLLGLETLERM